jgi:cation transport regulator ChaC
MRTAVTTVAVALIAVLLYLTNPTTEAFAAEYADQINAEVARELGMTGPVGQLLGGLSQTLIQDALESQVRRDDYLLASVFALPRAGEDLRVLGLAGRFISLDRE